MFKENIKENANLPQLSCGRNNLYTTNKKRTGKLTTLSQFFYLRQVDRFVDGCHSVG